MVHATAVASGCSIGVIIPARNEAGRVGAVVRALHEALQVTVPLLDDLLVVDADSQDATGAEAAAAGARVVRQRDVLPDTGNGPGKGEAMWKGLAASSTDLVVFVDADLIDPDPSMVVALVAPLLDDDSIALVRAAYDRPLTTPGGELAHGGGRVTELMARPLLATLWPELSWLAQPLGGEYAIRRSVIETVPLVRGYGVELGLTLDVAARLGAEAIAEVSLGVRRHTHQDLAALGRMATELLQVALDRRVRGAHADSRSGAPTPTLTATAVPQPWWDERGMLHREVHRIELRERPPLRP